ncbi:MAG: hypothetical protein IPG76_22320 [Acidobacteria bacterium]|nr:hypothetical protein [Acidobacteriota bacterium]
MSKRRRTTKRICWYSLEYFTVQLLTLGDVKRPIHEQVRELAKQAPRFVELMIGLARK